MSIKTYINPETGEQLRCTRGEQPEGFILTSQFRVARNLVSQISRNDLFNYYVIDKHTAHETVEHFNIESTTALRSLLNYYGLWKSSDSRDRYRKSGRKSAETQKRNWESKSDVEKAQWCDKQRDSHNTQSFKQLSSQINKEYQATLTPDLKASINAQKSATERANWAKNKETLLAKRALTAKINREKRASEGSQSCRSNLEQRVFDYLIARYPDLLYDVRVDNRYPFFVDFYIPSLDLFIELNGHPSHGLLPYTESNTAAVEESYRLHGKWLETYTCRDPEKLKVAQKHNLNYLMLYTNNTVEANHVINNNRFNALIDAIWINCNL